MSKPFDPSTGSLQPILADRASTGSPPPPPATAIPVDVLVLSNGPGEVSTWVRPVVQALRQQLGHDRDRLRISLILSPCPNASGKEVTIAQQYGEIDRIQGAEHFFPFLLWGKTATGWDWRDRGIVIFLGGDQLFPIVIGKRLGYRIVIYGEWETRWHRWGDRYVVMNDRVLASVPTRHRHKATVVGDLMADLPPTAPQPTAPESVHRQSGSGQSGSGQSGSGQSRTEQPSSTPLRIACLPGSKAAKLAIGVPFSLAIFDHIHTQRPEVECLIPVAPGLAPDTLLAYAQSENNPLCETIGSPRAWLETEQAPPALVTENGARLCLQTDFPAYDALRQCQICVTTVGANTAELGALGLPMVVLLPTQQMDAMRSWDGLPGLLANVPGVGRLVALALNYRFVARKPLVAWPNIWAGEEIVPELLGRLDAKAIAAQILDYFDHPETLNAMRDRLRQVRGEPGAGDRIADIIAQEIAQEMAQGMALSENP